MALLLMNIYRTPRGNLLQPRTFWRVTIAIRFSGSAEVGGLLGTYATACMMFHRVTQYAVFFGLSTNNRLAFGGYSAGPYQYDLITQQNSTVDSNGFYKAASPVIKLFGDGTSETNPESEGAMSERISEGVYKISGVLGFNSDESWGGRGWY